MPSPWIEKSSDRGCNYDRATSSIVPQMQSSLTDSTRKACSKASPISQHAARVLTRPYRSPPSFAVVSDLPRGVQNRTTRTMAGKPEHSRNVEKIPEPYSSSGGVAEQMEEASSASSSGNYTAAGNSKYSLRLFPPPSREPPLPQVLQDTPPPRPACRPPTPYMLATCMSFERCGSGGEFK